MDKGWLFINVAKIFPRFHKTWEFFKKTFKLFIIGTIGRSRCPDKPAPTTMPDIEMVHSKKQDRTSDDETKSIKILLADDHKLVRECLRELLESNTHFEIAALAEDGRTAVKLCKRLLPDIAIMDISMPNLNGIDATKLILKESPKTKVVMLSVHSHKNFVEQAFKAGASGYLLKDCSLEDVVAAIHAVYGGETYLHPKIATMVREDYLQWLSQKNSSSLSELSSREREVLQLIAEGKNTKETAYMLKLSAKTVDTHRQRIMKKLKIRNLAGLIKYAIREGLTTEEP